MATFHRWTGLCVGLLLVVMAMSGAGMVFRGQLEPVVSARLLMAPVCQAPLPPSRLVQAARAGNPDSGALTAIRMARDETASVRVKFSDGRWVYVAPCSGRVLGIQAAYGGPFGTLEWIHTFGARPAGSAVAGTAAVAALALVTAGLFAWRPPSRRRARLARGARQLALHRLLAPWIAPVLATSALTGFIQALPSAPLPPPVALSGAALDAAWSQMANQPWRQLQWRVPRGADGMLDVDVTAPNAPHDYATGVLRFDAASGKFAASTAYEDSGFGHRAYGWVQAVHYGAVGGPLWQLALFLAVCTVPVQAWTGLVSFLHRRRGPMTLRLRSKRQIAEGICAFEFEHPRRWLLPAWQAGAHMDVHIAPGLVRQYSLCGDPNERRRYTIAVLRCQPSRGGSQAMHEALREGDLVQVGVPRNHFALSPLARHSVLVAGGIGITPILAMADALAAQGASFELHYCCRSPAHVAFRERLANAQFHFSDEGGHLDIDSLLATRAEGTHLYMCGPLSLTDALQASAAAHGWPAECVHTERFSALDATPGAPFFVRIASSGQVVQVPSGKSALAALAEVGIAIPTSCGQGLCGSCVTGVLEGEPDHRDHCLTPEARAAHDCFTPCCSRARSAGLVLDL